MGKLSIFAATSESRLLEMQTFCSERFSATDPTLSVRYHLDSSAGIGLSFPFQYDIKIKGMLRPEQRLPLGDRGVQKPEGIRHQINTIHLTLARPKSAFSF